MDAYGSVQAGKAQAAQYNAEAALNERQAQDVDLQSVQASGQRREALRASLAAIEARRAGAGLSLNSPTANAIYGEVKKQATRNEQIEQVGFNNQKYALRYGASAKRTAASNAKTLGYVNGVTSAFKTAGNIISAVG